MGASQKSASKLVLNNDDSMSAQDIARYLPEISVVEELEFRSSWEEAEAQELLPKLPEERQSRDHLGFG